MLGVQRKNFKLQGAGPTMLCKGRSGNQGPEASPGYGKGRYAALAKSLRVL